MEKQPLIIAHRGASYERPENTIPAFQRALELHVDGIEFDLQMTQDRQLAVIHDPIHFGKKIIDTPSQELFSSDIPSLEQALALHRKPFYMIELKSHPAIAEEIVTLALQKLQGHKNLILASFCAKTVQALQKSSPFPVYAIAETKKQFDAFGPVDGYALHYKWNKEPIALELFTHSRLFYWTVDSPTLARTLTAHGIITNRPATLQKAFSKRGS